MTVFLTNLFLSLHNLARWAVVIAAIIAIVRAYRGWFGHKDWVKMDDRAGLLYVTLFDTQVLIGLILYFFFSVSSQVTLGNFGAAMANPVDRFFGLEHLVFMVVALVFAHIGRIRVRKAAAALSKHKQAALFFSVSVLVTLYAIPWEGLPDIGRPLFRLFGLAF
jgi:hypothetical protein